MKAIMVMFDTLSRRFLSTYGNDWVQTPNFERLKEKSVQFNNFYSGSLPCMPARRELHTGRYNFLHRGWGPIEPFDCSAVELLAKQGIYTHIVTDHSHYWEDGGATYLPRYSSWEGFRGQEGDRFKGIVDKESIKVPKQLYSSKSGESLYFNYANREEVHAEKDYSSVKTIQAGLDFIDRNKLADNWFLQIECFDPHEPFDVPQIYLDLYKDTYVGDHFDWPSYAPVVESEEEKQHIIKRYAALISMCDTYLGKVLDTMDSLDLWQDTMLIVNTDHGFLMGEHDWWGKNVQPAYQEIVHLPFYLYDPRNRIQNEERDMLAQTIDIPETLLDFFNKEIPASMLGKSLSKVLVDHELIHDAVLFGSFGGHINVSDGEHVYMRSCKDASNSPLYEYTLMPTAMRGFLNKKVLSKSTLCSDFEFLQGMNVLKIPGSSFMSSYRFGNKLFDLKKDPNQKEVLDNMKIELEMLEKMRLVMLEQDAPNEQYERLGIKKDRPLLIEELLEQRKKRELQDRVSISFDITKEEQLQILFLKQMMPKEMSSKIEAMLEIAHKDKTNIPLIDILLEIANNIMEKSGMAKTHQHMFLELLKNAGKTE